MELEVARDGASNDNNNAIPTPPTVIVTADCSPIDPAIVGAGDGEGKCQKSAGDEHPDVVTVTNARVQQLILENYDSSNVSDGDISANSVSDNEMRESLEPTEFVEPSDELMQKIIDQVEFYFSDANILKDAFLLKHVRRNKEGFVSLKLVTSFKKIKALTRDYRVVAFSLKKSDKLVVNDEKMKVRRISPLPDYDETTPSRTVVVMNIPSNNPTVDGISEIFSKCGEITLVRILRPGKSIPQDIKKYADKHPEIGTTLCAVVEFENHEFAKEACDKLSDTNNWRQGMRVVLLAAKKGQKTTRNAGTSEKNKKNARTKKGSQFVKIEQASGWCSSSSESDLSQLEVSRSDGTVCHEGQTANSGQNKSPRNQRRRNSYGKSKLATAGNVTAHRASPDTTRRIPRGVEQPTGVDSSPSSSPWVRRRFKANQDSLSENTSPRASPSLARRFANNDGLSPPRMLDMSGVLRQPRGPDGTPGFPAGRGRGQQVSAATI